MKKLVLILITALLLSGSGLVATVATYGVNVNNQPLTATVLNQNGTTYIPLKAVGQALGADVNWTGKSVEISTVDVEELKKACVMIYADDGKTQVQGSGVYTDFDEVISALHLTEANRTNLKTSEGTTLTLEDSDSTLDIMTLDPSKEMKPVKIGDSDDVKVGDKVIVVGCTDGINDHVIYTTVKKLTSDIVIEKTINGGGSGSALFDAQGSLIGIVVASSVMGDETYVIPINDIREAL